MNKLFFGLVICLLFNSCSKKPKLAPSEGLWLAELQVMDEQTLPFNFQLVKSDAEKYTMKIFNAEETIDVDEIKIENDSIFIRPPVFEGYIAGVFTENEINGQFIIADLDRIVPFRATYGQTNRFPNKKLSEVNISGIWEATFSADTQESYQAKGTFTQNGDKVTGTFETPTGDYRYLEGIISKDSLKLSTFDGAHAFLFSAQATDSTLNGIFYSGNHFKEPFIAKRNKNFQLSDADSLTFLKEGYPEFAFSFPDSEGDIVSLKDKRFENKVVIVQIMGSWCPNCLDETKFLVDYLQSKNNKRLEVVGLAFEYAKTEEKAFKSIDRLKSRIDVGYPILLAQFGTWDKEVAQQKLPMLNRILSYPTTVFIDKERKVRKIHTGFNGPATGKKFIEFKTEFNTFVSSLLKE